MNSKELRAKLREAQSYTAFPSSVLDLLDALDEEEAKGIVGWMNVPTPMWESPRKPSPDDPEEAGP